MQGFTREYTALKRGNVPTSLGGKTNLTVTARINGTTVTADAAADTKGSYATLITATNDVTTLWLSVRGPGSSASARGSFLDIAHGSGSTIVVPNLNIGNCQQLYLYIPGLLIPSGDEIKARIQCKTGGVSCTIAIHTDSNHALNIPTTTYITYGADTANSIGVSTAPGSSAFGASWTEIGTTSRNHYHWIGGVDLLNNTNVSAQDILVEFGVGPNSGSVVSMGYLAQGQFNTELIYANGSRSFFYPTTSGDKVWARIAGANTTALGVTLHGN